MGILDMAQGIVELGNVAVAGLFFTFIIIPLYTYASKKIRGW